jgi:predicted O-methyltransferase YrrM
VINMSANNSINIPKEYSQSRMSPFDSLALRQLLEGKKNLRILEIGSWLGAGSTQIFADYAELLVCVDHWRGNENPEHRKILDLCDPFYVFKENTKAFSNRVVAMHGDSTHAMELISDGEFDLVFIDGDHRYQQTRLDVKNCLPKLKKGGVLSGHDCEFRLKSLGRSFSLQELNFDHIDSPLPQFLHCHPGVVQAVDEIFGPDVNLFSDTENILRLEDGRSGYSTIWWRTLS